MTNPYSGKQYNPPGFAISWLRAVGISHTYVNNRKPCYKVYHSPYVDIMYMYNVTDGNDIVMLEFA